MLSDCFLGIDIGTSSVKAGLVSAEGDSVLQVSQPYKTMFGHHNHVEQDPMNWWMAVCGVIEQLRDRKPECMKKVRAITVSSHAPVLLGLDSDGKPLGNALIWMDRRAEDICNQEIKKYETLIHQYSCNRVDPYYMLGKLVWQIKKEPERYNQVDKYIQANGFVNYLLTGKLGIDVTSANLTQLMNVHTCQWEKGIFQRLDMDIARMPDIVPCSTVLGKIKPELAREWEVPCDVVVTAGSTDGSAVPYGLQLHNEGEVFEMSGTSSGLGVICSRPVFCKNLSLMKHVEEDKWFLKGSTSCSGGALTWLRDCIEESDRQDDFSRYSKLAENSVPGAHGVLFLPYLNGERAPRWNGKLRGVLFGFDSATDKKDIVRAIMEGTAYSLRTILEEFSPEIKLNETFFGSGGGYKSQIWSQIKADVLGHPIVVRQLQFDAAVTGDAFTGMKALGYDLPEKQDEQSIIRFDPSQSDADVYNSAFNRFQELFKATEKLF